MAAIPIALVGEWAVDPKSGAPRCSHKVGSSMSDDVLEREWAALVGRSDSWRFVHEFLYGARDDVLEARGVNRALDLPTNHPYERRDFLRDDRSLVFRARLAMLVFGLLLGLLVFTWARACFGVTPAIVALALYAFDPSFIAHGGLVTTDVAAAATMFGAVFTFMRALDRASLRRALVFALAAALAAVVKFSSLIIGPALLLIGAAWATVPGVARERLRMRDRLLYLVAVLFSGAFAAWVGIWAAYGFRFDAARDPAAAAQLEKALAPHVLQVPFRDPGHLPIEWALRRAAVVRTHEGRGPVSVTPQEFLRLAESARLPLADRTLLWVRDRRLLPESYIMGLAHLRLSVNRGAYLNGVISSAGFRSYFFWTALYKTSLPALVLIAAALLAIVSERPRRVIVFLVIPALTYFAFAVGSRLNIGHRHLLPVYPYLYVAAGFLVSRWPREFRRTAATVVVATLAVSCVFVLPGSFVAPHSLSYFNELAGGPEGGPRHLVDSNCDWGQDLPALRGWNDENNRGEAIQLSYFGSGDPRAYGIAFIDVTNVDPRGLSGLIAISVTNRAGVLWTQERRAAWNEALSRARVVGRAGYSILIYDAGPPDRAARARNPL